MIKGKMSRDRIVRLESIGFDFDPIKGQWETMFQYLIAYKAEHGDCDVPSKFKQNPALVGWCATQRKEMKKGKLGQDKIARLKSIGFDFDPIETRWEKMFQSMVAYKAEHGDCDVPSKFNQNRALAIWCGTQRSGMKKGKLSQEKIAQLDAIGFKWSLR